MPERIGHVAGIVGPLVRAMLRGDIGGFVIIDPSGQTELFVGLRELNDSGHTGVTRLAIGEDPSQTDVSILLIELDEMQ